MGGGGGGYKIYGLIMKQIRKYYIPDLGRMQTKKIDKNIIKQNHNRHKCVHGFAMRFSFQK